MELIVIAGRSAPEDARERAYDPSIDLSAQRCCAKKDGPPGSSPGGDSVWVGKSSNQFTRIEQRAVAPQLPLCAAPFSAAHGSVAKRSRPVGLSVLTSKVRISIAPPTSSVTAMRASAPAAAMTRAPLGSSAVTSAGALPSALKTR